MGFSLVELLVVISIVAILSVSSIVGFGYLGDILKAREVTSLLSDAIKQEELKVLRGDFGKSIIHFLPDYVVIEEQPEGADLNLSLGDDSGCADGHNINFTDSGNLIQKDKDGMVMQIKSVEPPFECIEFKEAEEIEWSYQLIREKKFSNVIRFIHFNLQRENLLNPISITGGADSKIEIMAPYGKRKIYDAGDQLVNLLDIIVEDESKNTSDTLTLH